jgi:hypothetical protein
MLSVLRQEFTGRSTDFFQNFTIIESILRERAFFFATIRDCEDLWPKIRAMMLSSGTFFAIYGAVMGGSHGPLQSLVSFFKLPMLFLVTLLICTPSLYFFNLLFGSKQRLSQHVALILTAMTTTSVLLLSFAPIIFFFLIITTEYNFFKLLNVVAFAIAGVLGLVFLRQGMAATTDPHNLQGIHARRVVFVLWILLYIFVGTQMAYTLSPFMGDPKLPFTLFAEPGGNFYKSVFSSLMQVLGR